MGIRVGELKGNARNPRRITDAKLAQLKASIAEFGDLSGVVFNRTSQQLVGGHQRSRVFADSTVTITKKYAKPTKTGTTALGYIEANGERFSYREVRWNATREAAANLAANKNAGEWDLPVVGEILKELGSFDVDFDLSLTMFDDVELEQFEDGETAVLPPQEKKRVSFDVSADGPKKHVCPRCEFEFP